MHNEKQSGEIPSTRSCLCRRSCILDSTLLEENWNLKIFHALVAGLGALLVIVFEYYVDECKRNSYVATSRVLNPDMMV